MRDHRRVREQEVTWRVAVVGGTPSERAFVGAAVSRHGGAVTLETAATEEGLREAAQEQPDVVVVSLVSGWHSGAVLCGLRDEVHCPVVLLTGEPTRRLLKEAREAGVMACLIQPLRPLQLAVTLDLAVARYREADLLRQRLADRKVIERAKGIIMAQQGLTEEQAFSRLRRSAMNAQRSLAEIASAVLVAGIAAAPI